MLEVGVTMFLDVACKDIGFIVRILAKLLKYFHFIIPILIIVLVVFDLVKVVVGGADDKAKKDAMDKVVKRIIYAVIIFLVPTILFFIFDKVDDFTSNSDSHSNVSATSWYKCFMEEYNK